MLSEDSVVGVGEAEEAEVAVITNVYSVARSLGVVRSTPYRVLKAMIDNPFMFGISIPRVRDEAQVKAWLREWEALVRDLGLDPVTIDIGLTWLEGPAEEAAEALRLVRWLIATGRPWVVIYVDHPRTLLGNAPHPDRLFGAPLEEFSGRRGFRVPWVALLRRMLNA